MSNFFTLKSSISALLLFTIIAVSGQIKPGGLVSYPIYSLGPNLLVNGGFEAIGGNGKPSNWADNGFASDNTVAHTGTKSFRITNANLIQYTQSASQTISLKRGAYRIGGWIKLQGLAATVATTRGVRLDLRTPGAGGCGDFGCGSTLEINGTSGWQYIEAKNIIITADTVATFMLSVPGDPDGTAWFDDVELREEYPAPADVFMMYPNYRGMLFDDQSQVIKFDITVNPPAGTLITDYIVKAKIESETTGQVILQASYPSAAHFIAAINGSSLMNDSTYLAKIQLIKISNSALAYEYPAYRISKLAGSHRPSMTMSFDEDNRFRIRDKPVFIRGVYDSGLGYTSSESTWENTMFGNDRRLFQLPVNFYLNYWYGSASTVSMNAMMNVLQNHDAVYLQTANCFAENYHTDYFQSDTNDNYVTALAPHPGFAGYYLMDECLPELAPNTFDNRHKRLRDLDPDGVNLAVSNQPNSLSYWRDACDILATDPYPLYGTEPAAGYPLHDVADWSIATRNTLKSSRPFITVIQFFQFTTQGRWPTQDEMRNMSYMAITEGANGLFYWSLGTNALSYVCNSSSTDTSLIPDPTGWCWQRADYFNRLKNVMHEISGLDTALTSIDQPLLLANSSDTAIHTRIKYANGNGYLISYNYTNQPVTNTFTWVQAPASVTVYNESRTINPVGSSFTDNFGPYQAHVYVIPSAAGVGTEEHESTVQTAIYPNPAYSYITLNVLNHKEDPASIGIYNVLGHEIISLPDQSIAQPVNIDISKLSAGIYFIELKTENKIDRKKFVKE